MQPFSKAAHGVNHTVKILNFVKSIVDFLQSAEFVYTELHKRGVFYFLSKKKSSHTITNSLSCIQRHPYAYMFCQSIIFIFINFQEISFGGLGVKNFVNKPLLVLIFWVLRCQWYVFSKLIFLQLWCCTMCIIE